MNLLKNSHNTPKLAVIFVATLCHLSDAATIGTNPTGPSNSPAVDPAASNTSQSNNPISCSVIQGEGQKKLCETASGLDSNTLVESLLGRNNIRLYWGRCQLKDLSDCKDCLCNAYVNNPDLGDYMGHHGYPNRQGDLGSIRFVKDNIHYNTGCISSSLRINGFNQPSNYVCAYANNFQTDLARRPNECINVASQWREELKAVFLASVYDPSDPCGVNRTRSALDTKAPGATSSEVTLADNPTLAMRKVVNSQNATEYYVQIPGLASGFCPVNYTLANTPGPYQFLIRRAQRTLDRLKASEKSQIQSLSSQEATFSKVCVPNALDLNNIQSGIDFMQNFFTYHVPNYTSSETPALKLSRRTALANLKSGSPSKIIGKPLVNARLVECGFSPSAVSIMVNSKSPSTHACYSISEVKSWVDFIRSKLTTLQNLRKSTSTFPNPTPDY